MGRLLVMATIGQRLGRVTSFGRATAKAMGVRNECSQSNKNKPATPAQKHVHSKRSKLSQRGANAMLVTGHRAAASTGPESPLADLSLNPIKVRFAPDEDGLAGYGHRRNGYTVNLVLRQAQKRASGLQDRGLATVAKHVNLAVRV